MAGRLSAPPGPRRALALAALALLVLLLHAWLASQLSLARLGEGAAERMPKRLEVAYVRQLAPAAPPAVAPVVVATPKRSTARAPAAAQPAASAASAPVQSELSEADVAAAIEALPQVDAAPVVEPATLAAEPVMAAASAPETAASAPVAFEWPPSTRLSYTLRGNYRGEVVGSAQVEWVRVGSRYQVHLDVWIGAQAAPLVGRRMSSDGELSEQGLTPRRYDEETRSLFRELRRRTILFEGDQVLLPNGKRLTRMAGMQDAASQFVQLTWLFTTQPHRLQVGQRVEVPLALPTNVDIWAYDVVEQVPLDTRFGPVDTFHLRPRRELRPNRDLVADVWFAPSLQYLPIRLLIRQDEATYVDLMIDRLPEQEATAGAAAASAPR